MSTTNGQPKSKREQAIEYALLLLKEGLLPSGLIQRLMTDLDLTPGEARDVAQAAMKRRGAGR